MLLCAGLVQGYDKVWGQRSCDSDVRSEESQVNTLETYLGGEERPGLYVTGVYLAP